jgi:hypothetical protein
VPGELVALALARPMQRQHIRADQYPDTQAAKPLDTLPECGMLALGGIQVGNHNHGQAHPGCPSQQPKCQGVGDPCRPLLDGVKIAGATMIASGSGSTRAGPLGWPPALQRGLALGGHGRAMHVGAAT